MFVAERFLLTVVKDYGKCPVSTEVEALGILIKPVDSWIWSIMHLFLLFGEKHNHHHHRKDDDMQYIKDRTTESVDIIFHAKEWRIETIACNELDEPICRSS